MFIEFNICLRIAAYLIMYVSYPLKLNTPVLFIETTGKNKVVKYTAHQIKEIISKTSATFQYKFNAKTFLFIFIIIW